MQEPTCIETRVRNPSDAKVIFHAVYSGLRPMVTRRLDTDEKRCIRSGCVFVWENTESSGVGIERWTDSIRWGPSRVRDEFLYYKEREPTPNSGDSHSSELSMHLQSHHGYRLVKQTYSVFVETSRGRRKWHMIAYYNQETLGSLRTVDEFPDLASIRVPPGMYRTARTGSRRLPAPGEHFQIDTAPYLYSTYHGFSNFSVAPDHLYTQGPSSASTLSDVLAPLEYLKAIPPPRRHPLDEEALMSFRRKPTWVQ